MTTYFLLLCWRSFGRIQLTTILLPGVTVPCCYSPIRYSPLASLSTRSTHLVRWRPLLLVPSTFEAYTFLAAVLASIRSRWPAHLKRFERIMLTIRGWSYSRYSSWLYRILQSPSIQTAPKMMRSIFLSKVANNYSLVAVKLQLSEPYRSTGSTSWW